MQGWVEGCSSVCRGAGIGFRVQFWVKGCNAGFRGAGMGTEVQGQA